MLFRSVAGTAAGQYIHEQLATLEQIREVFKNPKELLRSVENQLNEAADMRKKIEHLEQRLSAWLVEEIAARPETIGPVNFIARVVDVPGPEVLKKVCHDLKDKIKNHLAVLVASVDGKTHVAIGVAEELVKSHQLDAGKIIKEHVAPLIKGGGGGQKTLATAGGQDSSRIQDIFQVVKKLL